VQSGTRTDGDTLTLYHYPLTFSMNLILQILLSINNHYDMQILLGGGDKILAWTPETPFSKKSALIIMVYIIFEDYISVSAKIDTLEVKLHLARIWSVMQIKEGNSHDNFYEFCSTVCFRSMLYSFGKSTIFNICTFRKCTSSYRRRNNFVIFCRHRCRQTVKLIRYLLSSYIMDGHIN
jgi:hypothetical protein